MQAIVVLSIGWGINLISANYGYLILALIMVIVLAILFYFFERNKRNDINLKYNTSKVC